MSEYSFDPSEASPLRLWLIIEDLVEQLGGSAEVLGRVPKHSPPIEAVLSAKGYGYLLRPCPAPQSKEPAS